MIDEDAIRQRWEAVGSQLDEGAAIVCGDCWLGRLARTKPHRSHALGGDLLGRCDCLG